MLKACQLDIVADIEVISEPELLQHYLNESTYRAVAHIWRGNAQVMDEIYISWASTLNADIHKGLKAHVKGDIRSTRQKSESCVYLYLHLVEPLERLPYNTVNEVSGKGIVVRQPVVNSIKDSPDVEVGNITLKEIMKPNRLSYIKCTAWGRSKELLKGLKQDDVVFITGQLHGRRRKVDNKLFMDVSLHSLLKVGSDGEGKKENTDISDNMDSNFAVADMGMVN